MKKIFYLVIIVVMIVLSMACGDSDPCSSLAAECANGQGSQQACTAYAKQCTSTATPAGWHSVWNE